MDSTSLRQLFDRLSLKMTLYDSIFLTRAAMDDDVDVYFAKHDIQSVVSDLL